MALCSWRLPSLLRVPASPVPRSRRYYEGATTSHPRIHGRLLVRFHSPRDPPSFVSAVALPKGRRSLPGQAPLVPPGARFRRCSRVDANGISQVFRRSVPCLCSVPGPRSSRRALAACGHVDAAPAIRTAKASAMADFGANPQLRHPLPYASRVTLPHTCKACFRLAGSAFAGRESNPLDRCERFQLGLTIILLSCSPDATGFRSRSIRATAKRPIG
jgi:hypothetical protein